MKTTHLGVVIIVLHLSYQWILGFGSIENNSLCYPFISYSQNKALETPKATNDTLILAVGCNNYELRGNLMDNDSFNPNTAWVSEVNQPQSGKISCGPTGDFLFVTEMSFRGEVTVSYKLSAIEDVNIFTEGKLTIYVEDDYDCDLVINRLDIDDDNDGIVDFHEGDESVDTDGDGIANCYDIDSDNDGITDFTEWQSEDMHTTLLLRDNNGDGWDDAFDPQEGGIYYEQTDTDNDGTPDFLDLDSDDDGISDFVEAFDVLNNRNPQLKLSHKDYDNDGLDNSCDTLNCEVSRFNPMGSNSPLPDHNNNGIRDWRDAEELAFEGEGPNALASDLELLAYPNPIINSCTVKLPKSEDFTSAPYSLQLFDINGRLAHIELLYQHQSKLQLAHLKKGMYFLRVQTRSNVYSTRLIKTE